MITSECFAEIEAEAITLFERETKLEQADAQVTHDLVAEVRRLQAENVALKHTAIHDQQAMDLIHRAAELLKQRGHT